MRNADFGLRRAQSSRLRNQKRITDHESRTAQELRGQTNPPRRKPKATIETGRALPHVADGSARLWPEACTASLESRTTGHESRTTNHAEHQWPNKAISTQRLGGIGIVHDGGSNMSIAVSDQRSGVRDQPLAYRVDSLRHAQSSCGLQAADPAPRETVWTLKGPAQVRSIEGVSG